MIVEKNLIPFVLFISSILIYALFSLPFPKNPGGIEAAVGLLLILATGSKGILGLLSFKNTEFDMQSVRFGFWFLLLFPTITMTFYGWELNDFVRDIIPLVYMFFPLLILPSIQKNRYMTRLPLFFSLVGLIMSIRFFIETQATPLDVGVEVLWDNKKYFSYDPSVLFAAIWFFIKGCEVFSNNIKDYALSAFYFISSFICLSALAAVIQRAPLALFAMACVIYFIKSNIPKIYKVLVIFLLTIVSFYYLGDIFLNVFDLFYEKQISHGFNNKDSEFSAVFEVMSLGFGVSLFGVGWGGVFYNPAYGMTMSNTHSLVSYALIKTGLIGMVAFSVYGIRVIRDVLIILKYDIGITLASTSALTIGLLFQPTYKTLSYGVILIIVLSHSHYIKEKLGQNAKAGSV